MPALAPRQRLNSESTQEEREGKGRLRARAREHYRNLTQGTGTLTLKKGIVQVCAEATKSGFPMHRFMHAVIRSESNKLKQKKTKKLQRL